MIYIRKYFDFEVLGCVEIGNSYIYDMKIRNCYLYALAYDETVKSLYMRVFTLNGICVYEGAHDLINGFDVDEQGRVLVGYYERKVIRMYTPDMLTMEREIDLDAKRKTKGDAVFKGFVYVDKVGIIAYFSSSEIVKIPLQCSQ